MQINPSDVGRLALAVGSAGLAWWDQDFETGQVIRSDSWSEMLGYEPGEIDSQIQNWKDLLHPDDLGMVEEASKRHEDGETPVFEVEHRMRTKDGDWIWVLNWGKIIERDPSGRPLRAMGTHLDITRRKQAELDREGLIVELEKAMTEIKTLHGIIPICASCKKIRDDEGSWNPIEPFIEDNSELEFSHGICPDCMNQLYPGIMHCKKHTN